jgi:hypothetical protein
MPSTTQGLSLVVIALLAILVVLLMQLLWQIDIGHNDDAEGRWSILWRLCGVTAWVILVDGASLRLPCFRVRHLCNVLLGNGGSWRSGCCGSIALVFLSSCRNFDCFLTEVPASDAEDARHDGEEDLKKPPLALYTYVQLI